MDFSLGFGEQFDILLRYAICLTSLLIPILFSPLRFRKIKQSFILAPRNFLEYVAESIFKSA